MSYETTLLKLKRQYSKDEYVSILLEKLKESEIKNGENISYINELIDKFKIYEKEILDLKSQKIGLQNRIKFLESDGKYLEYKEQIKKYKNKIENIRNDNKKLINQLIKK